MNEINKISVNEGSNILRSSIKDKGIVENKSLDTGIE